MYNLIHGDCLEELKKIPDNYFHSSITDPPYGLKFMGAGWDHGVPDKEYWQEVYRVLKPGGYILAFGGSRTYHRLAVAIEDAGFEIRDTIMWVYGSGFPKGLNIGKGIDKKLGVEQEVVGDNNNWRPKHTKGGAGFVTQIGDEFVEQYKLTAPTSDLAKQWEGWNTNLKPAHEPIIMARKPLEGTVVDNIIKHGTGGINIDGCRVPGEPSPSIDRREGLRKANKSCFEYKDTNVNPMVLRFNYSADFNEHKPAEELGRYPANLIHDGSEEVLEQFPNSKSTIKRNAVGARNDGKSIYGKFNTMESYVGGYEDSGSAARFFYCAKASPQDRNEGCEDIEPQKTDNCRKDDSPTLVHRPTTKNGNNHPTVKPTSLMQYLCRLVTPKNGIILDPFMGSGSTGKAAILEGFNFVGIEKEADYADIARKRCEYIINRNNHEEV